VKRIGPIPPGFTGDAGLMIGGIEAETLVAQAGGTPLFAYDSARIATQVARFRTAFSAEVALHYAVKANPYAPLLTHVAKMVDGFDVASAAEVAQVAGLGLPITFAGPGKRDSELEAGVRAGVTLNLESEAEADRALSIASRIAVTPKLAIRVNPPFGLKGAGMKMGGLASPFGIDHDRVPALVRRLLGEGADWRGLHIYAGSQSLAAEALVDAQRATLALAAEIADQAGATPPEINFGGGFGIPYFHGDRSLDVEAVARGLAQSFEARPQILRETRFAIELGRWLVGEAGVYLTRVVDRKISRGRTFLVTDGGLHHMLAASGNFGQLLRRNYPLANATRFVEESCEEVTVTGCLCTPLDLLGDEVMLPRTQIGDLIAIFCAGAYGASASPAAFLGQPHAREMMI